jgi:hypothetical protein
MLLMPGVQCVFLAAQAALRAAARPCHVSVESLLVVANTACESLTYTLHAGRVGVGACVPMPALSA